LRSILIILFVGLAFLAEATHNRSGEITYRQTGPLTIEATITTYTKASSSGADRDTLELNWGDDTSTFVGRSNGNGQILTGLDIKVNYYTASHTYSGRATYTMWFIDPNRVDNILNLNFPNSVEIKFYIETTFTLFDDQFNGLNNSAILLQPPIDFACANQPFKHNPNAYDPDGDSLAYELVVPLMGQDTLVPNYQLPDQIGIGPNNILTLNEFTGELVWDSPVLSGEYNVAIKIKEYREGQLINTIIRDMQILVSICENNPPTIESVDEICVLAGERVVIPLTIDDEDEDQQVQLTATGAIFEIDGLQVDWNNNAAFRTTEFQDSLIWDTRCLDIREQPYQIVFRAQDNGISSSQGLSDLKTVLIYVTGPPPLDLETAVDSEGIQVSWESPYVCDVDADDYFRGFSVWRKIGTNPFPIDTCIAGLDNRGYEIQAYLVQDEMDGRFIYKDTDIETGIVYCYRVLANFSLKTSAANPQLYNFSRSLTSEEVCATANRNVPLLTAVDVRTTNTATGEIFVSWLKPIPEELDTIENTGPYRYQLERSQNMIDFAPVAVADFSTQFFNTTIDTSFLDTGLNTVAGSYYYRVAFYSDNQLVGNSPISESPYLEIASSDMKNTLSWDVSTSWQNYSFEIYRFNDQSMQFEFQGETRDNEYVDTDLINGDENCYYIKTIGTYNLPMTPDVIFNNSQELCGIPLDTVPPCIPILTVTNACEELLENPEDWELINNLDWNDVTVPCPESADLAGYNVYYSVSADDNFDLIAEIEGTGQTSYSHIPEEGSIACYYITSYDFTGNESKPSNVICITNCPQYELPNTFTPNGDGANDLFFPRKNRFIDQVKFELFNEWGNKVFETTDPNINWDGLDLGGREVDDGVYFYTCNLFELANDGGTNERSSISGYIQVIR